MIDDQEVTMLYQRILCATDGCEHSDRALGEAAAWAEYCGGELHVMHVAEPPILAGLVGGEFISQTPRERRARIESQVSELTADGALTVATHFRASTSTSPATAIAAFADQLEADVVVVGSRGRAPLAGALTGSVCRRLPHLIAVPLLIVPGRGDRPRRRVVDRTAGVTRSATSAPAARRAEPVAAMASR